MTDDYSLAEAEEAEPEPGANLPALATNKAPLAVSNGIYEGIAEAPFDARAQEVLRAPAPDEEIEIRPHDGLIYMPGILFAERLNDAFGVGGWAMRELDVTVEKGEPVTAYGKTKTRKVLYFTGALYVLGRFAAKAIASQEFFEENAAQDWDDAYESAKTKCLTRCCKHLGVCSNLWKPSFARAWVKQNAVKVWCPNVAKDARDKGKFLWRKKNAPPIDMYPYQEGKGDTQGHHEADEPRQADTRPATAQAREKAQAQSSAPKQAKAPAGATARPYPLDALSRAFRAKAQGMAKDDPKADHFATDSKIAVVKERLADTVFKAYPNAADMATLFLAYIFAAESDLNKLDAFWSHLCEEGVELAEYTNAHLDVVLQWLGAGLVMAGKEAEQFGALVVQQGYDVTLSSIASNVTDQAADAPLFNDQGNLEEPDPTNKDVQKMFGG